MNSVCNKVNKGIWISLILCLTMIVPVIAADQSTRLKNSIQNDKYYYCTDIASLNSEIKRDSDAFKKENDGRYIIVNIEASDCKIADNCKEVITGSGNVAIDTSKVVSEVKKIKDTDQLTVFGKVSVSIWDSSSYEIIADSIYINQSSKFGKGAYATSIDDVISGEERNDLTSDKRITYMIPNSWDDKYIEASITNNGVKGHQYFLNAISPQNRDYPEIFYIFYFDNETYIKNPPNSMSEGNIEDVEELIIKNILSDGNDLKVSISDLKRVRGEELDYFSTTYRPKDGHDYRLEFVFLPDTKGITCMLYLYYPKEGAVNHLKEVSYVIETLKTSK